MLDFLSPSFPDLQLRIGDGLQSENPPLRQVSHQRADAERPGLALVTGAHAVDQPAELRRRYGNDIVALVGKALTFCIAVLHRSGND